MRSALSIIALAVLFSQGTNANLLNTLFTSKEHLTVESPALEAAKPVVPPTPTGPIYLKPLTGS